MNYSSEREFRLWDYTISHRQLLLRSVKSEDEPNNIDIVFWSVNWITIPTTLSGLIVSLAAKEAYPIAMQLSLPETHDKIIQLSSGGREFFITAAGCSVMRNSLDTFESALVYGHIDRPKADYGEILLDL